VRLNVSMRQEPPRSRLRGLPLLLARSAALLVSIGVVTLVVARSGVAGCKSSADIGAEVPPSGAADTAGGPSASGAPGAAAGATATRQEDPEIGFMGGSKAPAGNWAFPSKPTQTATATVPAPNAPPQTQTAPQTPPQTAPQAPNKGAPTGALPPPPNAPNPPVDR
jgi:hypothetical protein